MASLDDTEDVALDFGAEDDWRKQRTVRHPLAAVFHLLFKVLAFVFYIASSSSIITSFVGTIVFASMDFWTVKNVTGRLLVGLRWWNQIDEDGKSQWVFETRKKGSRIQETSTESRIFWLGVVITPVLWFIFVFITLFSLEFMWLIIPTMGLCLSSSNLYGFLKCKVGSKQLSSYATQFLGQQVLNRATESVTNPSQGTR